MKNGIQGVLFDIAMFTYCDKLNRLKLGALLGVTVSKEKIEETCKLL